MRSHRTGRTLAGVLLTLGLVLGLSSPAAAADGWQRTENVADSKFSNGHWKLCIDTTYAWGCFQPHGEHFWLRDDDAEGRAVAIEWSFYNYDTKTSRHGVIYNNHGKNAGWTHRNKSFAEGNYIQIRVCKVRNLANRQLGTCSNWKSDFT